MLSNRRSGPCSSSNSRTPALRERRFTPIAVEQDLLARIRTLLAIERNYLAEERTALAEFRTGITLALVSPPAISVFNVVLRSLPDALHPMLEAIVYLAFIGLTIVGAWISVMSRKRYRIIRHQIHRLKTRQREVMKDSDAICSLLDDCIA